MAMMLNLTNATNATNSTLEASAAAKQGAARPQAAAVRASRALTLADLLRAALHTLHCEHAPVPACAALSVGQLTALYFGVPAAAAV